MRKLLFVGLVAFSASVSATNFGAATGLPQSKFVIERFDRTLYASGTTTWTAPYTGTYWVSGCAPGGGGGGGHSTAGGGGGGGGGECVAERLVFCAQGDVVTLTFPDGGAAGTGGASPTAGGGIANNSRATFSGCTYTGAFALGGGAGGAAGTGAAGGAGGASGGAFNSASAPAAGTNANISTHNTEKFHVLISSGSGGGTTAAANGVGRIVATDAGSCSNNGASNNEGGAGGSNALFGVYDDSTGQKCVNYGSESGANAPTVPVTACGLGGGGGGGGGANGNGAKGGPACWLIGYESN